MGFWNGNDDSRFNDSGRMQTEGIPKTKEELLAADESLGDAFKKDRQLAREDAVQQVMDEDPDAQGKTMQEYTEENGFFPLQYLVRGAQLYCQCGSHRRRLNLPLCHGVYITGHPMMHKMDCLPGDEHNISTFGVCSAEGYKEALGANGITVKKVVLKLNSYHDTQESLDVANAGISKDDTPAQQGDATDEDLGNIRGYPCIPDIVAPWFDTYDKTLITENYSAEDVNKVKNRQSISGSYMNFPALTTDSFLVCAYGGIIEVIYSGQGYVDVVGEGYQKAQELEQKAAATGVDISRPHELDGEDSPYGSLEDDRLQQNTEESGKNTPPGSVVPPSTVDGVEQPGDSTDSDEENDTIFTDEPPKREVQNKTHWCYATCALLMSDGYRRIDTQTKIDAYIQYHSNRDNRNYYTELSTSWGVNVGTGIRPAAGYDSEKKYYCHPEQEYVVALARGMTDNNEDIKTASTDNGEYGSRFLVSTMTGKEVLFSGYNGENGSWSGLSNYWIAEDDDGNAILDHEKIYNEILSKRENGPVIIGTYNSELAGHNEMLIGYSYKDGIIRDVTLNNPMNGFDQTQTAEEWFLTGVNVNGVSGKSKIAFCFYYK